MNRLRAIKNAEFVATSYDPNVKEKERLIQIGASTYIEADKVVRTNLLYQDGAVEEQTDIHLSNGYIIEGVLDYTSIFENHGVPEDIATIKVKFEKETKVNDNED